MQKSTAFENSLPIVAAALGRFCGVKVELGEGTPCTDGQTIRLPLLAVGSPEEERKILGILCHESAHVRFTDMKLPRHPVMGLEFAIDNALEDARIERAMDAVYPGAERLFEAAHRDTVTEIVAKPLRSGLSVIPLHLLAVAERHVLRRDWMQPLVEKSRRAVIRLVGNEATQKMEELALEVKDAKSVHDVREIRRKVMGLLRCVVQGQCQTSDDENRKTAGTVEKSIQADGGQSSVDEPMDGEGRIECANAPTDNSSENGTGVEAMGKPDDKTNGSSSRLAELLAAAPGKVIDNPMSLSQAYEKLQQVSQSSSSSKLLPLSDSLRPVHGDVHLGEKRLKQAKEDSSALRTSLMGLVQAKRQDHRWTAKRGRRLETRQLSRLVVGNCRVFQSRSEHPAVNTAVHVLLDLSGSMGGRDADLATRAALGLIYALESIPHVNPALTVFPGTACGQKDYACCTVVGHGKRLASIDPREVGSLDSFGGTPIVEALTAARMALATCRESAKAVFVITDGSGFPETLSQVVEQMEQSGIRLFGVQIGEADHLGHYISATERIQNVADLKAVLFRFAKRLLA